MCQRQCHTCMDCTLIGVGFGLPSLLECFSRMCIYFWNFHQTWGKSKTCQCLLHLYWNTAFLCNLVSTWKHLMKLKTLKPCKHTLNPETCITNWKENGFFVILLLIAKLHHEPNLDNPCLILRGHQKQFLSTGQSQLHLKICGEIVLGKKATDKMKILYLLLQVKKDGWLCHGIFSKISGCWRNTQILLHGFNTKRES